MHSIMYTSLYRTLQHTNSAWAVVWGVLGVSRLHCTLATGGIVSKYAAGLYARETFPTRWHRIVYESLRIRGGGHGRCISARPPAAAISWTLSRWLSTMPTSVHRRPRRGDYHKWWTWARISRS